ncbi:MAG: glutathione S-transferase N-terminal domain-containing protein [Sandaracinus sp.]
MTASVAIVVGRPSSHFTRIPRVVAHALGVPCELELVPDLTSTDAAGYAGNPSLKVPALRLDGEVLFGAESAARALAALARPEQGRIVWPEEVRATIARNAHEVAWTACTTQVQLALATKVYPLDPGSPFVTKLGHALRGALAWLDAHAEAAIAALPPERTLSLLEVTLVCLVEHVEWRETASLAPYPRLTALVRELGARPAFAVTRYRWPS